MTTQAQRVISRETTSEELNSDYQWGFTIDIEEEAFPKGLSEDVVRLISAKKNEPQWMLDWRLRAYRFWSRQTYTEPTWANISHPPIDYQDIHYYAAPKSAKDGLTKPAWTRWTRSWLRLSTSWASPSKSRPETGWSGRRRCPGQRVGGDDLQGTPSKRHGVIFCSFTEAIQKHPELVQKYLGSVVPYSRQLLRLTELGCVQRRLLRLHPSGSAVPSWS